MPELRKDPIVNRWVVVAPERANRPMELSNELDEGASSFDPFAEGNEASTTPEVFAFRAEGSIANKPGWRVRVISNKYPALRMGGELDHHCDDLYQRMNGLGTHDVIVECPHNENNLSHLTVENIREVLSAYQFRMRDLKTYPALVHALIFKNKGTLAGASLRHSHSQMIATPVVPIAIDEEISGARQYYNDHSRSVFHELVLQELATKDRIVLDADFFVAFCPYASRFPFETWILPKQDGSHFENTQPHHIDELGFVLKTILLKLEHALDDPPYNYVLHSAPFSEPELPHYRWHMEIFPRLTRVAGFEWGSGIYINQTPPEEAARILREVIL